MSKSDTVRNRILDGFKKNLSEEKILKSLDDEDADLVGDVWVKLQKQGKIPKNKKMSAVASALVKLAKELVE